MLMAGSSVVNQVAKNCELPPLILHPFDAAPVVGLEDLLPSDDADKAFLETRYSELRMLCFLGRDLDRWLTQCVECASAERGLAGSGVSESTFITQLLFDPPASVIRKMQDWGVGNFQIIFSRSLGLNMVYAFPPEPRQVTAAFLRDFHQYADALFDVRLKKDPVVETDFSFPFEVYASSEYSKRLERFWADVSED
jgi:hypothetical protein